MPNSDITARQAAEMGVSLRNDPFTPGKTKPNANRTWSTPRAIQTGFGKRSKPTYWRLLIIIDHVDTTYHIPQSQQDSKNPQQNVQIFSPLLIKRNEYLDDLSCLIEAHEPVLVQASSRNLLLKLSMKQLLTGFPGRINLCTPAVNDTKNLWKLGNTLPSMVIERDGNNKHQRAGQLPTSIPVNMIFVVMGLINSAGNL